MPAPRSGTRLLPQAHRRPSVRELRARAHPASRRTRVQTQRLPFPQAAYRAHLPRPLRRRPSLRARLPPRTNPPPPRENSAHRRRPPSSPRARRCSPARPRAAPRPWSWHAGGHARVPHGAPRCALPSHRDPGHCPSDTACRQRRVSVPAAASAGCALRGSRCAYRPSFADHSVWSCSAASAHPSPDAGSRPS